MYIYIYVYICKIMYNIDKWGDETGTQNKENPNHHNPTSTTNAPFAMGA